MRRFARSRSAAPKAQFASRIKLIRVVQCVRAKYSFRFSEMHASSLAIRPRHKGRIAIVTT